MGAMLTFILLATLVVYTYQLVSNDNYQRLTITLYQFQTLTMLYTAMMTLGLTWAGFKNEGKTWWLLKSAPTSPNLLFHSRLLVATLCAAIYANFWMLSGLIFFEAPIGLWLPTLGATSLVTAAAAAFNTAPRSVALGGRDWNGSKKADSPHRNHGSGNHRQRGVYNRIGAFGAYISRRMAQQHCQPNVYIGWRDEIRIIDPCVGGVIFRRERNSEKAVT